MGVYGFRGEGALTFILVAAACGGPSIRMTSIGCEVQFPTISLDISFVMPRLVSDSAVSTEDRFEWLRFIHSLWAHEQGHAMRGMRAVAEIRDSLQHLHTESCAALSPTAAEAARKVQVKYTALQAAYTSGRSTAPDRVRSSFRCAARGSLSIRRFAIPCREHARFLLFVSIPKRRIRQHTFQDGDWLELRAHLSPQASQLPVPNFLLHPTALRHWAASLRVKGQGRSRKC